ncbi:hypothetical protein SO802_011523 [Lithocarpus litseifolius]|uniref:PGG domain-containing protein n=1 Tax=Lithocarpus litseifolius TaxID=425828 RepID=A0AAW2D2B3_9ROSI
MGRSVHTIPRSYAQENETNNLAVELYTQIMLGSWSIVVEKYRSSFDQVHDANLNMLKETAVHLAVSHGPEDIVEELVHIISDKQEGMKALKRVNSEGNTPLHLAAVTGSLRKCICIAQADPSLGNARNEIGASPLFLAALYGKTDIFVCLRSICRKYLDHDDSYCRKKDGETILHCAIKRESWDLAYQILLLHKNLATSVDEHGILPLNLLADKPAAFRSGCHLGWWNNMIYHCILVEDVLKPVNPKQLIEKSKGGKRSQFYPENCQTLVNFYQLLQNMAQVVINRGKALNKGRKADVENGSNGVPDQSRHQGSQDKSEGQEGHLLQRYSRACFDIVIFVFTAVLVIIGIDELKKIKVKHILSLQVLKNIIGSVETQKYLETGQNPELIPFVEETTTESETIETHEDIEKIEPKKKETSILTAARNGITEMVEEILKKFPMAIHDDTDEGKNVVLLAVENKHPKLYQLLLKKELLTETMLQKLDEKGNNALHLAAKLVENKPWLIPGAALQMQWEIKWYEYVKSGVPQYLLYQSNNGQKTPAQVFTEHHMNLVEKGGKWLNKTSESCSVVAALIATVAFATSTTIPGGIKESSGSPTLETYPAFDVFAVTSLVALCFSVTALFLFLAILTSRYQEKDFRSDLPRKLLLGLTSLFVSIASMLVSFCAGHFFVLKDKLKNKALPVYAVTCLPITFYAIAQFPLYFDLVRTYFRKVPRASHKVFSL